MLDRRDFLKLAAVGGGAVFVSGLQGCASALSSGGAPADFHFVQLSDTHWGFEGPPNPDAANTLKKAVATVNALDMQPELIVFTGDLTHTTDDASVRRKRMGEFRDIVRGLKVQNIRFLPGEHDAALDAGAAYKEFFGDLYYSFDHKGVHFVALDNTSDPGAAVGDAQIEWLKADLAKRDKAAPVIVLTHRPLFDLAPKWDWATRDGARVVEVLLPYPHVTVFYGHIHQEHRHMTSHIAHHAAKSLIFPLPAPGSQEKRAPLAWNPAAPNSGLGIRDIAAAPARAQFTMTELPVRNG